MHKPAFDAIGGVIAKGAAEDSDDVVLPWYLAIHAPDDSVDVSTYDGDRFGMLFQHMTLNGDYNGYVYVDGREGAGYLCCVGALTGNRIRLGDGWWWWGDSFIPSGGE